MSDNVTTEVTEQGLQQPVKTVEERITELESRVTAIEPPKQGGFFGGADDSFIPLETTTKLYSGPVMGGKRTRRHKNKRHSYSRKSKKGNLKNKLKRLFGFKGGEGKIPTFSLPKGPSGGGSTTVKPHV